VFIQPVGEPDLVPLFEHLKQQLTENGTTQTGYFAPQPKSGSCLHPDKELSFRKGLVVPVGSPGWRRAWVARASGNGIIGHVDLRAHPQPYSEHRCLLGMGVKLSHRGHGLGAALLAYTYSWAMENTALEWIDLQVLSTNRAAIRLYVRAGFVKVGEVEEMFKLDGILVGDISMTKRIARDQTSLPMSGPKQG
jgi:ribosomal protein S18 acetylase RimI-like enzyme